MAAETISEVKKLKAYRSIVYGFDDGILHAESRAKAKYVVWRQAHCAGFRFEFGQIRILRAQKYDDFRYYGLPITDTSISEDIVKRVIEGGPPRGR